MAGTALLQTKTMPCGPAACVKRGLAGNGELNERQGRKHRRAGDRKDSHMRLLNDPL